MARWVTRLEPVKYVYGVAQSTEYTKLLDHTQVIS